jgi:hypothetical protein
MYNPTIISLGLFSIGICALSLVTLLGTHLIEDFRTAERRPYYLMHVSISCQE